MEAGGGAIGSLPVYTPERAADMEYDRIIIASLTGLEPITEQLLNMGVPRSAIDTSYIEVFVKSRLIFLDNLADLFNNMNIPGAVAEGGVFQGEFAKEINRAFPDKTLYLFDTFSGFDKKDTIIEKESAYSDQQEGHLDITTVELVKQKLPHPEKCVIREGYFPETTLGIDDTFCFVNLDFDLYNPTLAGLEFFYPRMVPGGVILIHDYFNDGYKGVRAALSDYMDKESSVRIMPIGDGYSIAICC